jgi:hypothetical protein
MKKPVLIGILFAIFIVAFLIYTSFGNRRYRCEVCVSYQNHAACRKASGATQDGAQRSATDNACAQVASGMTATMVCTTSTPVSIRWLN